MEECLFCDTQVTKEFTLFKDSICFVTLDKFPSDKGHLLVISNDHYPNMLEAPEDVMQHMFKIAKRFGIKAKTKLNADGMTIQTNVGKAGGQIIYHFHIHVTPRYLRNDASDEFNHHREISKELKDTLLNMLEE